ncbi:M20 aminoacylase family protein [Helicobacter baculiformis]|uniref:M20 aminoacylase family protein n=1 Tax=Helicobacter baculiformis TaxID=427351 RepID=A0ABV7ZJR5_9HELI|nr:M20 aminoacylase family protein [Helicobacter baculiformis]
MSLIEEIVAMQEEFIAIRRQIHQEPEIGFEEVKTSKLVAEKLRECGYEVHTGIGKTGVVGVLKKGDSPKKIGLRADMDALPMLEDNDLPYKSQNMGKMHACGHDGHSASLLLAAKYLATQDFNGTLNLYFQPAEEGLGGAKAMLEEGLLEKFDSDFIFGWHNMPLGTDKKIYLKSGAIMASADSYTIEIKGQGGHGSAPEKCKDPIVAASLLVVALQSIVSRNIDPQHSAVVSVGAFNAGNTFNIIPDRAVLKLSVRALDAKSQEMVAERIKEIAKGVALAHEIEIEITKQSAAPVTINDPKATAFAQEVAKEVFGEESCCFEHPAAMGSEDFGYFAQKRPCAYAFLENENTHYIHTSTYVFNDALLTRAASYYARLVLKYLGC